MIERIFSPELVNALGWTLIHTLWQGALFALLLGVLLIFLRRFSAQARYVVSVGMLFAFFLTVGVTFVSVLRTSPDAISTITAVSPEANANTPEEFASASPAPATPAEAAPSITSPQTPGFRERSIAYFDGHLPLIVTLWLMGVLVLQLRFLGQIAYIQRLKSYGTERFPAEWAGRIQELEEALRITRPVRYLSSVRIVSPLTVGWLRPVVLFPRELIAELRDTQIAAILAHELAHVKRHDFAVNLLQTFLATFFFYHPGLWWISSRIHDEREHACDDLAIEATGKRLDYARTLVQLQENQLVTPRLTMGLAGQKGGFANRVKRLLNGYFTSATYGEGIVTSLIFVATFALAVVATGNAQVPASVPITEAGTTEAEHPNGDTSISFDSSDEADGSGDRPGFGGLESTRQWSEEHPDDRVDVEMDGSFGDYSTGHWVDFDNLDLSKVPPNEEFRYLLSAIMDRNLDMFYYFLKKVDELNKAGGHEYHYFTPLMAAASENSVEMVQALIDKGADVNFINPDGWTALIEAADEGAYECAKLLIERGAKVDLHGPQTNVTALRMAASEGHPDIMDLLLEAGAELGEEHSLHAAAGEGKGEVVDYLLGRDADVNQRDEHGRTPLMHAAEEGKYQTVLRLIQAGAKVNARSNDGRTALLYAAAEGKADVIRLLMDNGGDATARGNDGRNALLYAAAEGKDEVIRSLLTQRIDVDARDNDGRTPLMYAAAEDKGSTVKLLLRNGADPNAVDNRGRNAAAYAAEEGSERFFEALTEAGQEPETDELAALALQRLRTSPEILIGPAGEGHLFLVRNMLATGIDVNIADERGRTALSEAAAEGHSGIVDYLLNHGANVNGAGGDACTPLFQGAREGHPEVVRLLLDARADVNVGCDFQEIDVRRDKAGFISRYVDATPLLVAITERQPHTARLLLDARANVNETFTKSRYSLEEKIDWRAANRLTPGQLSDKYPVVYDTQRWTPLMEAVENGTAQMVRLLLEAGADPKAQLEDGTTALDLARKLQNGAIIRLLE